MYAPKWQNSIPNFVNMLFLQFYTTNLSQQPEQLQRHTFFCLKALCVLCPWELNSNVWEHEKGVNCVRLTLNAWEMAALKFNWLVGAGDVWLQLRFWQHYFLSLNRAIHMPLNLFVYILSIHQICPKLHQKPQKNNVTCRVPPRQYNNCVKLLLKHLRSP